MDMPNNILDEITREIRGKWDHSFRLAANRARYKSGELQQGYRTPIDNNGSREVPIYGNMGTNKSTFQRLEGDLDNIRLDP